MPRTAAVAVDQPNIPAALRVILDAIPNDRLAGLLYELARVAGVIDVPEPTPLPATAGKRGPGWPKGRKRGPRKVRIAEPAAEPTVEKALPAAQAKSPNAKLRAKRDRENAARRSKRAAAHAGNGSNGAHSTGVAATPSATPAPAADPVAAKRARLAREEKARRARKAAERQASSTDKDAAAARLWAYAVTLNAKEPWKAVAGRLNLNMAVCVDAWRSRELPPGVEPEAVHRFIEASPN